MPELFLDKDLNDFINENTLSEEEFFKRQAELEVAGIPPCTEEEDPNGP